MTIQKETELIRAIIVYCQRCQEEGDFVALSEMGFGPREIVALRSLTTTDALRLASTRSHFLSIKINQEIYWRMIDYVNREKEKEDLIDELILHEAPLPMMHVLTGMGSKEFTLRRRKCGFGNASPGRPSIPNKAVSEKVWSVLKDTVDSKKELGPREFMDMYVTLNREVSLRVIWHLIRQWDRDGTLQSLRR